MQTTLSFFMNTTDKRIDSIRAKNEECQALKSLLSVYVHMVSVSTLQCNLKTKSDKCFNLKQSALALPRYVYSSES